LGVRITLKPVNGNTASIQAGATKVAGRSFLDTLAEASSDAANRSAFTGAASKDSASDTADHGSEDQTSGQPIAASENGADDALEIFTAGGSIGNFAAVIGSEQNQDADPSRATLTIGRLASSAHSQPQSKASQPAEKQATDSIQQAGDQGAEQQLTVSMPAVPLSEVSIGRSMQWEAASPTASADLPASPAVLWSNAKSTEQTGSDAADASQSPVPSSASPAVSQSEVSFGRSTQYEAASQTASAKLPAFPTAQGSNANSIAQTGSNEADASQNSVPPSASPALTDPSLLAAASAAELVEQSAFAVGSTFSPSMILSTGAGAGTLTDRASQFKSSGPTFTVNSGDTSSSKASSAQDSISADHSAQNGNPLPQHAPGDSSAATPLAIKPLEATVTQTVPVSSHTASVSSGQPHAASSTADVPIKAQDSADAAAEQLERAGSTAAAGINTARLMQSMSESEMRVGMHSAEFGDISIRTSVSQQQLMAQISVDHSELGSAISAHLPSLQSKLGSEFGLHASIEVNQLGGSGTGGNGQSSHQNNKMTSQSVPLDSSAPNAESDRMPLPGQLLEVDGSRLDIRA
jgi:hypothetical protein